MQERRGQLPGRNTEGGERFSILEGAEKPCSRMAKSASKWCHLYLEIAAPKHPSTQPLSLNLGDSKGSPEPLRLGPIVPEDRGMLEGDVSNGDDGLHLHRLRP